MNYFYQQLPPTDQLRASRFKFEKDSNRFLIGRILLYFGLRRLKINLNFRDIRYSEFERPSLSDIYDFNISHSGEIVVCAITQCTRVGIDVELCLPINVNDFREYFSPQEWKKVDHDNPVPSFYSLWTLKEAAIKANGNGFNISLSEVQIIDTNRVKVHDELWYTHLIEILPTYCCHLATLDRNPKIYIEVVGANTLTNVFNS